MTTRTGFLSAMLLGSVLLSGGRAPQGERLASVFVPSGRATATPNASCAAALNALAAEWGATDEWRALAPYPVPREASPTGETGVWIERAQLDGGRTELRRVSARQTDVATIEHESCIARLRTYTRHYNADSLRDAFTDQHLDSLLRSTKRGMIYVWSPRMPYSVRGLEQARQSAEALGIAFTALVTETNDAELRTLAVNLRDAKRLESLELVYRNATIHYPAALFYDQGRIIDGVFPGYKNVATYVAFAERQFGGNTLGHFARTGNASENTQVAPKFWVDRKATVTNVSSVNTPRRIGFFFKPITGTNLVSYNAGSQDYFFNVKTGEETLVPGHVDPVPTPDGRFLTLPGLVFYRVPALLAGDMTPMHVDRTLPDEYQTASILSESRTKIRYRVVTGWNAGARFRDYDVSVDTKGTPVAITPLDEAFAPCKDRLLTLPINAKSGTEFGAFDAVKKTNLILDVTDPAHCTVKLDLGFASGKISFSYDGQSIAFATSRINTDAEGELIRPSELAFKDALVLVRKTGRIVNLSQNAPINGMTFPEFLKDGTVMLLDQFGPGRAVEQLRVVRYK